MSISSRISSMEEHLKESYQELEGIGIDTTGVNNNLENIPKLLDGYWETLPKVTGEGTSITLDNTKEGKMKVLLKGNTYQDSTTGANLMKFNERTSSYLNYKCDDKGQVTASGTMTGSGVTLGYNLSTNLVTIEAGTYVLNVIGTSTNVGFKLNGSTVSIPYTFTTTETSTVLVEQVFSRNVAYNVNYYITLAKDTATTERYTDGASPNPDYPQEVHVVSGDNEVEVVNSNYIGLGTLMKGYTNISTFTYVSTDSAISYLFEVSKLPDEITFSATNGNRANVGYYDIIPQQSTQGYRYETGNYMTLPRTITINREHKYILIQFSYGNEITQPQINKGSSLLPYEEYKGTTYPINLPEGMFLGSIGDYKDRFFKTSGKNLFDISKVLTNSTILINNNDGTLTINAPSNNASVKSLAPNTLKDYCPNLQVGDKVYLNANTTGNYKYIYLDNPATTWSFGYSRTITQDDLDSQVRWYSSGINTSATISNIIISKENILYEPYGSNEWYLEKKIGKVVLDGSESWNEGNKKHDNYSFYSENSSVAFNDNNEIKTISNYFIGKTPNEIIADGITGISTRRGNGQGLYIRMYSATNLTLAQFKTWLSTHNTTVYYVLATPTYTKIEGTLASQLEALNGSKSYTPQTNISQNNNDMASVLNATALSNGTVTPSLQGIQTLSLGQNVDLQTQEPIEEQAEEVEEQGEEL